MRGAGPETIVNDPARLRVGIPAVLFDAACAAAAAVFSYRLRFESGEATHFLAAALPALAVILVLQLALGVVVGLYRLRGQVMWPVRLASAALVGGVVGVVVAFGLGFGAGLSRQAVGSQVALFAFGGSLWRSIVGLRIRQRRRQALAAEYGGDALVVQGEELASMTGGLTRVWHYRHLLRNLVAKDLHLKYRGSVLGFAWSILIPLLMIGVYTLAFTYVMNVDTPRFVLFLLIGLLAWNFFGGAVGGATEAVSGGGSLLKSVVFPRAVLPLSVVLFHLVQYLLTMAVFLPVMLLVYRVRPTLLMLLFPLFLVLQVLFITGLALGLSAATALFRDVRHLVDVGIGMLFWATPIIYEMKRVPEQVQFLALLSPAAPFIRAYQDIFYYGTMPELSIWVVAIGYALGAFVCGLSVFLAYESRFSELV
jgi:ABC-type polysaccharide/polyol phosphate export permease